MKAYYVLMCGNFQGTRRFDTFYDAQEFANIMQALTGQLWTVKTIMTQRI